MRPSEPGFFNKYGEERNGDYVERDFPDSSSSSKSSSKDSAKQGLPLGSFEQQTNIKCLNVRGLALISNKVKVNLIEDLLEYDNSIGIILSETWLDESICNAEIQMENFMLYRSDRSNRQRGGVAL